jgi:hypothetical protein
VVVGAVVIAIAFSWAYPIRNALFTNQKSFTELRQQNRTSTGLEEWLPRWASLDVANRLANEAAAQVVIPSRTVSIQSWGPEMRQFRIGDGEQGIATIRTFFYPYWQIQTSEGQALRTGADEQGVLLAGIPRSPQTLTMRFVRPPHQIIANILSLTGTTFLAVLALSGFLNKPAKESLLHIRLNPFAEGEIK